MPAISTAILGTAAATATASASTAAASVGGSLAAVGGLTGVASVAGAGASIYGTVQANAAAQKQADLQQDIIKTEEMGAKIEAARQRRQIVRDTLRAQALSETTAAAGGALMGSGIAGGINQAANSGAQSTRDVNQNLGMALNISDIRGQQANASADEARAKMISSIGQGVQTIASNFATNQERNTRVMPGPLSWLMYGQGR